jgi:hypothetical protein
MRLEEVAIVFAIDTAYCEAISEEKDAIMQREAEDLEHNRKLEIRLTLLDKRKLKPRIGGGEFVQASAIPRDGADAVRSRTGAGLPLSYRDGEGRRHWLYGVAKKAA